MSSWGSSVPLRDYIPFGDVTPVGGASTSDLLVPFTLNSLPQQSCRFTESRLLTGALSPDTQGRVVSRFFDCSLIDKP